MKDCHGKKRERAGISNKFQEKNPEGIQAIQQGKRPVETVEKKGAWGH